MLGRCYSPETPKYPDYGGRGIKVDPELHSFENYIKVLESLDGYDDPSLDTIDRIDNNDDYKPGNLRWASQKEQRANRRRPRNQCDFIATDPDGAEHLGRSQAGFARRHNLNKGSLGSCLRGERKSHKGWTFRYKGVNEFSAPEDFEQVWQKELSNKLNDAKMVDKLFLYNRESK